MRAIRPADEPGGPGPARRRGRGFGSLLVVAAVLSLAGSASRGADAAARRAVGDVPAATAARLARQAMGDRDALAELEAVTEVDGRPVDLRSALAGAKGADRRARLEALAEQLEGAAATPSTERDPVDARRRAVEVLDQDKYHPVRLPRPLRGPLRWVADRLDPLVGALAPIGRGLAALAGAILGLPGGHFLLPALGLAVLGWVTARIVRRRTRGPLGGSGGGASLLVDVALDPDEVEARADSAEAAGDHAAAVRLRYEAGLVRLVRAERLVLRPDTTPAAAAEQVGDPALGPLTVAFEEIVYGERRATATDSEAARHGWRQVRSARVGR